MSETNHRKKELTTMGNLSGFDATQHQSRSFDPIPPGWHTAIATECEWKDTKSGTGRYLQFTFEIQEGDFKGRKIWERLNLENVNQTAVDIAQASLADLCRSVGVLKPNEAAELLYKPVQIKTANREYNGEQRAEIKGYRALFSAPTSTPSGSTEGSSGAPWRQG